MPRMSEMDSGRGKGKSVKGMRTMKANDKKNAMIAAEFDLSEQKPVDKGE